MIVTAPNGCFSDDSLVLTGGDATVVARGFECVLPDFSQASSSVLNTLQDQVRLALRSLPEHQRLQIQWFCDPDYGAYLDRYERESERTVNAWVCQCRSERVERYRALMRTGQLRRQRLVLFVTQRLIDPPLLSTRRNVLIKHLHGVITQVAEGLCLTGRTTADALSGQGIRLTPMRDADHYQLYARLLNPSLDDRPDYNPLATFAPSLSLHDNCWLAEAVGTRTGFELDGYSHALLVLTRWPQSTYPGILHRLTRLHQLRFQITLNVEPLPVMDEIQKEERRYARLQGEYKAEGRPSLATVLEKKEHKIHQLMKGFLRPFRVQFIVRVWARNPEELTLAMAGLKQAINGMNGAQYFQPALPSTTRKLWFQTWPGWTWGTCRRWYLYAEDTYLADLLPLTSSACGYLAEAEAIYDGPEGSLVGVKTASQPGPTGAPQHAVIFGATGSGKSMLIADLLTQT
ncbi:MAG TPA: TraC family protein [Candidatus Paceibacterota bacterium]|nr:TraC family protein [Candidatus Paceibacterota bacterium]